MTQRLVAYRFYGSYGLARTVWMDGRPHPPANARHTYEGFSTGRWEGNRLAIETTHLKAGFLRRNGIAHSDRARMTRVLRAARRLSDARHGRRRSAVPRRAVRALDGLPARTRAPTRGSPSSAASRTAATARGSARATSSSNARRPRRSRSSAAACRRSCRARTTSLDMFAKRHGVPLEAALGGSATLYPEYAARLRDAGRPARADAAAAPRASQQPRREPRRHAEPPGVTSLHVAGQVWLVAAGGRNVAVQVGRRGRARREPGPRGARRRRARRDSRESRPTSASA